MHKPEWLEFHFEVGDEAWQFGYCGQLPVRVQIAQRGYRFLYPRHKKLGLDAINFVPEEEMDFESAGPPLIEKGVEDEYGGCAYVPYYRLYNLQHGTYFIWGQGMMAAIDEYVPEETT